MLNNAIQYSVFTLTRSSSNICAYEIPQPRVGVNGKCAFPTHSADGKFAECRDRPGCRFPAQPVGGQTLLVKRLPERRKPDCEMMAARRLEVTADLLGRDTSGRAPVTIGASEMSSRGCAALGRGYRHTARRAGTHDDASAFASSMGRFVGSSLKLLCESYLGVERLIADYTNSPVIRLHSIAPAFSKSRRSDRSRASMANEPRANHGPKGIAR